MLTLCKLSIDISLYLHNYMFLHLIIRLKVLLHKSVVSGKAYVTSIEHGRCHEYLWSWIHSGVTVGASGLAANTAQPHHWWRTWRWRFQIFEPFEVTTEFLRLLVPVAALAKPFSLVSTPRSVSCGLLIVGWRAIAIVFSPESGS